jgi:hypothetical protein
VTLTLHPLLVPLVMKEQSYTSTPPMGRTACTEPQCLYKGALYLFYVTVHYTIPRPLPPTILPFQLLIQSIILPCDLSIVSLYIDKYKQRILRHTYNGSAIFLKHPIVESQLAICPDLSHEPRFGSCNIRRYDLLYVEWLCALLQV